MHRGHRGHKEQQAAEDPLVLKDPQDLLGFKEDRAHRVPPVAPALLEDKERKAQPEPKDQPGQLEEQVQLAFSAQLPLQWE